MSPWNLKHTRVCAPCASPLFLAHALVLLCVAAAQWTKHQDEWVAQNIGLIDDHGGAAWRDKLVAFGGSIKGGRKLRTVLVFDVNTYAVDYYPGKDMEFSNHGEDFLFEVVGDKVVSFGSSQLETTFEFDLLTKQMTAIETSVKPPARLDCSSAVFGDTVYMFSGYTYDDSTFLDDLWAYNSTTQEWRELSPPQPRPSKREDHAMVALPNGKILLFGGIDEDERYFPEFWLYDIFTNTWEQVSFPPPFPSPREDHRMHFDERSRYVYMYGGAGEQGKFDEMWRLHVDTMVWSQMPSLRTPPARWPFPKEPWTHTTLPVSNAVSPPAVKDHVAGVVQGKFVIFGGDFASGKGTSFWIFDPAVCPNACNGRSACVDGICAACQGDYAGPDCGTYRPVHAVWKPYPLPLLRGLDDHISVVWNEKLVSYGGYFQPGPSRDFTIIDLATQLAQDLPRTGPAARYHVGILHGDRLFVWGGEGWPGSDDKPDQGQLWAVDLVSKQWSSQPELGSFRPNVTSQSAACGSESAFYVFGGFLMGSLTGLNQAMYKYTYATQSWSLVPRSSPWPLPVSEATFTAVMDGKCLLYGGGTADEGRDTGLFIFDTISETWTDIRSELVGYVPATPTKHAATATTDGTKVYVYGGEYIGSSTRGNELYFLDLVNKEWVYIHQLPGAFRPDPCDDLSLGFASGVLALWGGNQPEAVQNRLLLYTPSCPNKCFADRWGETGQGVCDTERNRCVCGVNHTLGLGFAGADCSAFYDLCSPGFFRIKPEDAFSPEERERTPLDYLNWECVGCALGQFSNSSEASACLQCALGTAVNKRAQTTCVNCLPGYYTDTAGQAVCRSCSPGFYNEEPAASTCSSCPPNSDNANNKLLGVRYGPDYAPVYDSRAKCECDNGLFGEAGTECTPCPNGATCCSCSEQTAYSSSDFLIGDPPCPVCLAGVPIPIPRPGYLLSAPDNIHGLGRPAETKGLVVIQCVNEEACEGGYSAVTCKNGNCIINASDVSNFVGCSTGYAGKRCGSCDDNFFLLGKRCNRCNGGHIFLALFALIVLVPLLLIVGFFVALHNLRLSSFIILMDFFQDSLSSRGWKYQFFVSVDFFAFASSSVGGFSAYSRSFVHPRSLGDRL